MEFWGRRENIDVIPRASRSGIREDDVENIVVDMTYECTSFRFFAGETVWIQDSTEKLANEFVELAFGQSFHVRLRHITFSVTGRRRYALTSNSAGFAAPVHAIVMHDLVVRKGPLPIPIRKSRDW